MDKCPVSNKCGGCQLQHLTYPKQLQFKKAHVAKLLSRFGEVNDVIGMENPANYRCKIQTPFGYKNGKILSGVYEESTHNIVETDACMLEDTCTSPIIKTIKDLCIKYKIKAFDDKTMRGDIRHVLIRKGYFTNQIMVVIVTSRFAFPNKNSFIKELLAIHPEITTLLQNINDKFTSLVLGDETKLLHGKGYIEDTLLGLTFRISAKSFYQVNPQMTEKLYAYAIDALELKGNEEVIDAYCGTGTIGLLASRKCRHVIGIESNGTAVRDAILNAQNNNIKNVSFFKADATRFIDEMAFHHDRVNALILDPPRSGSTQKFVHSATNLRPEKIVYISCEPKTLARDLLWFEQRGYKTQSIQPFDMFPYTGHVETVCLLINQNAQAKHHVNVGIDAEDYYKIKESHAE